MYYYCVYVYTLCKKALGSLHLVNIICVAMVIQNLYVIIVKLK